jgi:hypothetical protein
MKKRKVSDGILLFGLLKHLIIPSFVLDRLVAGYAASFDNNIELIILLRDKLTMKNNESHLCQILVNVQSVKLDENI